MPIVEIYTLRGCSYCVRAKALLDSKGAVYQEHDATADEAVRRGVCQRSGHRTFPQIFVDGTFLGGCDEVLALNRKGQLDALLA